jgi:hypothetical protein
MVLSDDDLRIADLETENMRRMATHGGTMLREMKIISDFFQVRDPVCVCMCVLACARACVRACLCVFPYGVMSGVPYQL